MRSRQSISCSLQYQHQQVRTPRALRAAFRKARRDQSPVLTSGAFSTEYVTGPLNDDDDMMLSEDHHYIGYSDPRWASGLGWTVTGKRQRNGVCKNGYLTGPVDDQKNGSAAGIDPLDKSIAAAVTLPRAQRRVLSETLDVEEVSDEEMSTPSKTAKPAMFLPLRAASKGGPLDRSCQDIDFDTSLDADMNVILGMASDMELVMPKFDDEYLDDLKNDPTLQSPAQHKLSTIHKDIDNLRRHRDSLRKTFDGSPPSSNGSTAAASSHSPPLGALRSLQASSSSSSNPAPTNEQKSKGQDHIYFKPSHHALPERIGNEHQGVMIIQSNQWTHDNARVCPYPLEQGAAVGNNHIFTIQESLTGLPATTMPLDKNAIMTTNNISLATANMEVLTPQEVLQEDYYARNLRVSQQHQLQQQRRRRRSSGTSVVSATTSSSAAAVGATMAHGTLLGVDGFLPPRGTTTTPRSCSSSHPPFLNGIHPLDKPALPPVHAIGPNPVPASYYIPPSAFRTEAVVAAEEEAERKRKQEEEELKDSFLVFPSPLLS
ncbi:hypothetical protein BGZ72_002500 [Mortierella alpina]|nr:hypothetical protein BGZ72_002500 [Mortierella alpina]